MDYGIVKLILLPQELIRPIRLPAGLIFKGGTISGNSKSSQTRHSKDYCIFTERMKHSKYIFLAVLATLLENCMAAHTCVVDSFTVKEHFDLKRYGGKWYALAKKDPEGLFLQDNISAEYTIGEDGIMTASSKGRVKLFGFWVICADMAAHYSIPDPAYPAKMYMIYQGLASYLSSGGDNYWVIDTDYDNYAITYACRSLKTDGTCKDGYSIIFSRNPHGFTPAIQRIIRQKQEEICMSGQFQPVLQSGALALS